MSVEDVDAAFKGGKMADSVTHIEARLGRALPDDFVPTYRARLADAFRTRLRAIDGALDLVSTLSVPFCVASSGPREKMELTLSLTGLLPYFRSTAGDAGAATTDRLFSCYELGTWKPDPGLFLHAARAMGVEPRDCLVVEDSLPGILGGLAAGTIVVAFQPHGVDPRLPAGIPVIRRLLEVRDLVAGDVPIEALPLTKGRDGCA
jgi:beta-phosphoglucomutase-like phosphatase (HAD superfamily)